MEVFVLPIGINGAPPPAPGGWKAITNVVQFAEPDEKLEDVDPAVACVRSSV